MTGSIRVDGTESAARAVDVARELGARMGLRLVSSNDTDSAGGILRFNLGGRES